MDKLCAVMETLFLDDFKRSLACLYSNLLLLISQHIQLYRYISNKLISYQLNSILYCFIFINRPAQIPDLNPIQHHWDELKLDYEPDLTTNISAGPH